MTPDSASNFESTDCLGLKSFCERIESFLLVEHDYVDGSLVLGLNAGFGAGKTTFLNMWESDLRSRREQGEFVPMPLVLNAWESDYCGDPLLAILANLIEALDKWNGEDNEGEKSALKEAAKDMAWFALGLGNGVAAKFAGIDAVKAGDFADVKKNARKPVRPDFIELYHQRADALTVLKEKLAETFGGETPKILVFVDELDRCRPDYAVSYLETIKHVFDVRGMVFVLAFDYEHLANSARALFGKDLDFDEYFRKFCHRLIHLPKPDETGFRKLAANYVKKFLEIEGKRTCGIELDQHRIKQIVELAVGLDMKPRQLQEAFRIVGHVSAMTDPAKRGKLYWCIASSSILLAFVRVARPESYSEILGGRMSPENMGLFLISVVGKKKADWWFKIYLTGQSQESGVNVEHEEILRKAGFLSEKDTFDRYQALGQFSQGWGHSDSGVSDILRRIEAVESF